MSNIVTPDEFREKVKNLRDPKKIADAMSHPLVAKMEQQDKHIQTMYNMIQRLVSRFHALLDYLNEAGIIFNDDEGDESLFSVVEALTSLEGCNVEYAVPVSSYSSWVIEHDNLSMILEYLNKGRMSGRFSMPDIIEKARGYNNESSRKRKLNGAEFGLDGYLALNPDNLEEEELEKLADEFGLVKVEEEEMEQNTEE